MAFVPDVQAVCIIFQHANCAKNFLSKCAQHFEHTGVSIFGADHEVSPGQLYALNDDLRKMDAPVNARRRLTFARSQLFQNGMTEARFRADIEAIVGAPNIELLWLFNTGNGKSPSDIVKSYANLR